MATYRITFADGQPPIDVDGWNNVEPTLRAKYGHAVLIGHDGDLSDGGNRTLFWSDADAAADDDGTRALGSVVKWSAVDTDSCDECGGERWPEERHATHCSLHPGNIVDTK
jgi:hypothetical protein